MQHLLLLHGAIGAKDQLQPVADALSDKYQVHTFNFSGHGGTAFSNEGFSIPVFAAEVVGYLKQKYIDRANIFGYSMGGYVAMYLAKKHPSVVGKIITLATKFYWDESVAAKEIRMLDPGTILQKIPAFAGQLKRRHDPNDWKIVLAKTRDMLTGLGRQNALQIEDYTTITALSLLLLGENDKMVTADETIAVQNAVSNAEFKLLQNAGHAIEQVDVNILIPIIHEFMSR